MRVYLYLAERNKKDMKLLSIMKGEKIYPTQIKDVKQLSLPKDYANKIAQTVYENRMHWDLWIESAENYTELKKSLKNRGFKNIPFFSTEIFPIDKEKIVKSKEYKEPTTNFKPPEVKSMVRRKSS